MLAHRMSMLLSVLAPLVTVQTTLASVSTFSGSLERVGDASVSIRLLDRRIIDALLPNTSSLDATALVARFSIGDQVEVNCKSIQPVWEAGTSKYQSLEVTSMRLIRHSSPEELSKILAAIPFREGKNLLKRPEVTMSPTPPVADVNASGGRELAHARLVNLEYAANLPNFVADETAKRFRRSPDTSNWRDFDLVESEITIRGNHAERQHIRRNRKPWSEPFDALPGFKYDGFGTEIRPLFDAKCPKFEGRSKVEGKTLLEYRFTSPVDGCFPYFFFNYQRYNPARTGHVFIDDPAGHILRLEEEAHGFPAEIEFAERKEHIFWDYVKVGAESHLLPVRASFLVRYYDGTRYRIEVEYRNHRHFEATSNVTFQ